MKLILNICENSNLGLMKMLKIVGISNSKYYTWKKRAVLENQHNGKIPKHHWLTPDERKAIIDFAMTQTSDNINYNRDGYRRIAYAGLDLGLFAVSPASVYRVLKEAGLINEWSNKKSNKKGTGFVQPEHPHKDWHTDIKMVNFHGTFLFFISVIDGYSRYLLHHEVRISMTELDVEITLQRAHEKFPDAKPNIISDNGGQYVSKEFGNYLKQIKFKHIRTSTYYPQSNGKIERFHRSLSEECLRKRSFIDLEDAQKQISKYVSHYNNNRLHSSLNYLRPVDYLFGNPEALLKERQNKIDRSTRNRKNYWSGNNNVA